MNKFHLIKTVAYIATALFVVQPAQEALRSPDNSHVTSEDPISIPVKMTHCPSDGVLSSNNQSSSLDTHAIMYIDIIGATTKSDDPSFPESLMPDVPTDSLYNDSASEDTNAQDGHNDPYSPGNPQFWNNIVVLLVTVVMGELASIIFRLINHHLGPLIRGVKDRIHR
jgi:hypothetical protein